ncbi:protein translocase SEC61 complex subunit gamma [Candidatus Pacearchaeota archaeon]|nr:protein translocase SEC61 complex subunit gamma [Candidatus Pacearchaeota archaeon]
MVDITGRMRSFFVQCVRVWHLLRKPSTYEFKTVAKISALGVLAIGALGFIVSDAIRIVGKIVG